VSCGSADCVPAIRTDRSTRRREFDHGPGELQIQMVAGPHNHNHIVINRVASVACGFWRVARNHCIWDCPAVGQGRRIARG
jgi:hypothetical protein